MVTSRNSRTISRFVFVLFACLMASGCEPQDADCAPSEKVCDEGDYDADLDRCILDDEVVVDESGQPLQATCPVSSGTADCLDSEKTCAVGVYNPENERCEMGVGPALDERGNVVQPLCPQQDSEGFEQAAGSSGDEDYEEESAGEYGDGNECGEGTKLCEGDDINVDDLCYSPDDLDDEGYPTEDAEPTGEPMCGELDADDDGDELLDGDCADDEKMCDDDTIAFEGDCYALDDYDIDADSPNPGVEAVATATCPEVDNESDGSNDDLPVGGSVGDDDEPEYGGMDNAGGSPESGGMSIEELSPEDAATRGTACGDASTGYGVCIDAAGAEAGSCAANGGQFIMGECAGSFRIQCCVQYACENEAGQAGYCIGINECSRRGGSVNVDICPGSVTCCTGLP